MDEEERTKLRKERETFRKKLEEKNGLKQLRKELRSVKKGKSKSVKFESLDTQVIEYQKSYYLKNKEAIAARKKKKASQQLIIKRLERLTNPKPKKPKKPRKKVPYTPKSRDQKNRINERLKERRAVDKNFRLSSVLRARLNHALKGRTKVGSAVEFLGCSVDYLISHIETQFTEGMTWDNYGTGKAKWSIDHIVPLSMVDLTNEESFIKVNNYLNLRPLWNKDQIKLYHSVQKHKS
jgi:hypothetical protein